MFAGGIDFFFFTYMIHYLIHFMPLVSFLYPLKTLQKRPPVFWCFQGVWKEISMAQNGLNHFKLMFHFISMLPNILLQFFKIYFYFKLFYGCLLIRWKFGKKKCISAKLKFSPTLAKFMIPTSFLQKTN